MRALAVFLVAFSCGTPPPSPVKALQPNTEQACVRAELCGVFMPEQRSACVACLEHIDQALLAELRAKYGDLPPLEQATCEQVAWVGQTNLRQCVVSRWYGP